MKKNILFIALIIITFLAACTGKKGEQKTTPLEAIENEDQDQKKVTETKIEDSNELLITDTGVMGFNIGDSIIIDSKNLRKSVQETGEGSFPGYALLDNNGEEIGFIFPQYKNENRIDMIEISSSKYRTKEGLGVGSTYEDLKKQYPNIETHGSEMEGSTGSKVGGISFLLNVNFWAYDIDESQIPPSTEIIQVTIMRQIAKPTVAETPETAADEATSKEVKHYICFNEDNNKNITIWVSYNAKGQAIQVKYKGTEEPIDLVFIDEVNTNKDGAHPVLVERYDEIYEEKVNGQYAFTHSGIWDYVEYTRGSDSKVFNFTIDHDANPYGTSPCF